MARMTTPAAPAPPAGSRWQPATVTRLVSAAAWTMLFAQSAIIVTGALVRLTGSGLGCPTWPMCTDESLVNTPEMGIHGYIEFGNRLLGVALGLLGVAILVLLWRLRRTRPDLFWLTFWLTAVVPFQALLGGLTVRTQLNPWIVAAHFIPSAIAVGASAYLVRRTADSGRDPRPLGTPLLRGLCWAIGGLMVVIVLLGVLVTGAGPHAGDVISARNGLDTVMISRLHAIPVWMLIGATVLARILSARQGLSELSRALTVLLLVEAAQGAIGYFQYFTGLPIAAVALHLVGACLVIAATVAVVDACYRRAPLPATAVPDSPQAVHQTV